MGVFTYNALISAFAKVNQPEQALEVFQAMQQRGVAPNAITYNALVSACEKGNQPKRALAVVQEMRQQGAMPNAFSYNALFSACARDSRIEWSLEAPQAMRQLGLALGAISSNGIRIHSAASIGFLVGSSLACALLRFRRRSSAVGEEPLLASYA